MGVRINTNVDALDAQRNLNMTGLAFGKSVEKLSSGLRINRAADDATGLSISEKLRAQVRGLDQAVRNAQDGISLVQTADGALNETASILQRVRELAIQASNGTLTDDDMGAVASEMDALGAEIDRIATTTSFNSKVLLDNSLNSSVAVGSGVQQGSLGATSDVVVSKLNVSNAAGGTQFDLTSTAAGTITLTNSTTNVAQTVDVNTMLVVADGTQTLNFSTLGVSMTLSGYGANGTQAKIIADLTGLADVTTAAGGALSLQIGANANQTMNVSIEDAQANAIGAAGGYSDLSAAIAGFVAGKTTTIAQNVVLSVDEAITNVSENRATLGAYQNRLEHTVANLGVESENLAASESRIRDVDMAAEMVKFTRSQILQQAGTAILAQANSSSQTVLQLLRYFPSTGSTGPKSTGASALLLPSAGCRLMPGLPCANRRRSYAPWPQQAT